MKLTIPKPGMTFVIFVIVFQLLPVIYILLNSSFQPTVNIHSTTVFRENAKVFFYIVNIYLFIFIAFYGLASSGKGFRFKTFLIRQNSLTSFDTNINNNDKLFHFFWLVSALFIAVYAFNGGLNKLFLLGSEISSREFRFLGFDNIPRIFTAFLQIARRLLLPVAILYFLLKRKMGFKVKFSFLLFLICLQLFASAMTMSRAPFLTLFVVLLIPTILFAKSKIRLLFIGIASFMLLIYFAAFLTKIQYNILDFSSNELLETGINFVLNRMWVVPAVTPINLSFSYFDIWSDWLYLAHSRISILWGGAVVGTAMSNSIFVSPVGFIGDIWRNFGPIGILIHSSLCSFYFLYVDNIFSRLNPISSVLIFFITVALVLYWIMGVFFSQGAMIIMILLPIIASYLSPKKKVYKLE